jgi:iron complex outermembrane recepter protein
MHANKRPGAFELTTIATAALLSLMTVPTVTLAQQATPATPAQSTPAKPDAKPASDASDKPQLQVIEVTANKRVERLENVPSAISVLSSELIERNNVRSFEDVITLSPALTVTYGSTPANNGINLRGIGTSSIGIGVESDVSVILDDVPLGLQFQAFQDLSDVLRIEILKGPQSTLFGKSAIAGAVLVTTKRVGGPLRAEVGSLMTSDGELRLRFSGGGDITEKLAFRVAASKNEFDGNVDNLTTGTKINGSNGKTLMAKLAWRPTEDLNVEFTGRYNATVTTCCALVLTNLTPRNGGLLNNIAALPATTVLSGINIGPENRSVRNDVSTGLDSNVKGLALKVNYTLPNEMVLTSITSREKYEAVDSRDQDFVDAQTLLYFPLANGRPAGVAASYKQGGTYLIQSQTQEFRLTSPDSGPVRYVAGLWYGKNEIDREFIRGYRGIALTTPSRYFATTYNVNKAVYGQASWEFIKDTTVTGGVRVNEQDSGYDVALGLPPPGDFVATSNFSSNGNKEKSTTGKLSLQHQFVPSLMGYVTAATGYKGQAYDITSGLNAQTAAEQPVASETAKTLELGAKGNFFGNRLTVNVAAFYSKFKDYQQNSGSFLPGTTTFVTRLNSVPGVETKGLELDLAALLTRNWLVNGSVAYTDATVTEWRTAPCYNVAGSPNGGFNAACRRNFPVTGSNTQDVTGGRMPNAPRWKGSLSSRYDIVLDDPTFDAFVVGSVRAQSGVLTNINQDPSLAAPKQVIANLGVGFKEKKGRFQATFTVHNLFDRAYANTGFTGAGNYSTRAPNPVLRVSNETWTPARDAFRYFSLRLDAKF